MDTSTSVIGLGRVDIRRRVDIVGTIPLLTFSNRTKGTRVENRRRKRAPYRQKLPPATTRAPPRSRRRSRDHAGSNTPPRAQHKEKPAATARGRTAICGTHKGSTCVGGGETETARLCTTLSASVCTVVCVVHVPCAHAVLHCAARRSASLATRRTHSFIHVMSCHVMSYHIISYHIISYHIISYHIKSYHILSYHRDSVRKTPGEG